MEIATMHDMSNTRKEIAARLGFAAGNGAKAEFGGMKGLGDWTVGFTDVMQEKIAQLKQLAKSLKATVTLGRVSPNGMYSGTVSRKYGPMEPPDFTASTKVKQLIKSLGGYENDSWRYNARPGAKAAMAKPPRKYEHGDRVYIMDGNKRVGSGVIDYMFDYDDFVGTYIYKVRQEDGGRASYNETSLKKMSRPGAKAEFAAHPSWSEGILGKDTDPKLAAYSWISKNNIESGRKQMLLADLAAGMYEKNPSMSIAQAVLAAAKDMVSKGVATRDIQQWAENGGKFSRPGAKAEFGNADRLDSLMAAVYRALKNNDKAAAKRLMADAAKEIDENTPSYILAEYKDLKKGMSRPGAKAEFAGDIETKLRSLISRFGFKPDKISVSDRFGVAHVEFIDQKGKATEMVSKLKGAMKQMGVPESAIKARENQYPADQDGPAQHIGMVTIDFGQMKASRLGAKTRMTREQTEEQKAGLKIMSAADPAVGAKIATLIKEGKPQDQAVAIALDMKRRGEL